MGTNISLISKKTSTAFKVLMAIVLSITFLNCGGGESSSVFEQIPGDGSVTLAWQAPTDNEDGTPLTDLAGYRVYYGEVSGTYTNFVTVGNSPNVSIGSLPLDKTLYFAVKAFDTSGNESTFSNEVSNILSAN